MFLIPFMLTCSVIRFLSLLLLSLCAGVVSVVTWSYLDGLRGCLGTLCGCSGEVWLRLMGMVMVYVECVRWLGAGSEVSG